MGRVTWFQENNDANNSVAFLTERYGQCSGK